MPSYAAADRARITDFIFDRLASGLSLAQIAALPGHPSQRTLLRWARADPHLAALIAHGRAVCRPRERHPFNPTRAADLLLRVRRGEPLSRLLRRPDLPNRRALDAWKRQDPAFAADLEAAKAFADPERRRYGHRRARMPFDQAVADRIMLAVLRGATLAQLHRDPSLPGATGLKRWCAADPDFDAALRSAMKIGFPARRRAGAQALCAQLTHEIVRRIADGASLFSLGREPGMPCADTLYNWVREHPAFAIEIAEACQFRDWMLADQAQAIAERLAPADLATARRAVGAINQKLGQLNRHPGAGRRQG
ncbi:MAG: hypothetical protein KKE02_03455 [Alphaproteobacteria bacterium]|nr:hypothetical protein [Alphaproteobacteria bacterium]MBU1517196.1 hypothetical protein [Alphaproteobacteria bacterium]MBU2093268.1 hypothetical protein [Alphaproteobacteria bacterium]MBU2150055.1 hypothetical protein [Alphaproteobacteria bacterium]MBU2307812.1 hypothetical protein [Alphaproteobacteria bacterium]